MNFGGYTNIQTIAGVNKYSLNKLMRGDTNLPTSKHLLFTCIVTDARNNSARLALLFLILQNLKHETSKHHDIRCPTASTRENCSLSLRHPFSRHFLHCPLCLFTVNGVFSRQCCHLTSTVELGKRNCKHHLHLDRDWNQSSAGESICSLTQLGNREDTTSSGHSQDISTELADTTWCLVEGVSRGSAHQPLLINADTCAC